MNFPTIDMHFANPTVMVRRKLLSGSTIPFWRTCFSGLNEDGSLEEDAGRFLSLPSATAVVAMLFMD
jgi:hypothetical protein